MHDTIGRDLVEDARHRGEIGKIDLVELEPRPVLERCEARVFQRGIVVWRERVDTDDLFPAREQALTHMHADKAGSAGHNHRSHDQLVASSLPHCNARLIRPKQGSDFGSFVHSTIEAPALHA